MGRLSDMYGGKRLFVFGVGWLFIFSILGGTARTDLVLIFARALQGLGPAAFLPSSVMLLGSVYRPGPRKNLVSHSRQPARGDQTNYCPGILGLRSLCAPWVLPGDIFCRTLGPTLELALVFFHRRTTERNILPPGVGFNAVRQGRPSGAWCGDGLAGHRLDCVGIDLARFRAYGLVWRPTGLENAIYPRLGMLGVGRLGYCDVVGRLDGTTALATG